MSEPAQVGDVIWANAYDTRGAMKDRPMVVIAVETKPTRRLICCCITTSPPRGDTDRFVGLPAIRWSGLSRASWAALDWLQEIDPMQIRRISGRLPIRLTQFIIDGIEEG